MIENIPYKNEQVGQGDIAIYRTVTRMAELAKESSRNPYVRYWAERIVKDVAAGDKLGEVRAIYEFVKTRVRYTRDPYGWEYVMTPYHILKVIEAEGGAYGDCDDMALLGATLMKAIGFRVGFKWAGYRESQKFTHIYGLVNIQGRWMPFDCVKLDFTIGDEAKYPTRFDEMEVE